MIEHVFAVHSCNAWACSAWVNATRRQVQDPPPQPPQLSAPSGSASGSYKVSWSDVYHAASYTLQERTNSGSWHKAYSGSGLSKSYSGKANGSYGYRVMACNNSGCSSWSSTKTVTVAKPPTTPAGLTVYVSGPDFKPVVHASWQAASRASRYDLQMRKENGSWATTMDADDTDTQWSQLIIFSGEVDFRVRACNAAGCSGWSDTRHVILQGGIGLPPLSTSASMSEGEQP